MIKLHYKKRKKKNQKTGRQNPGTNGKERERKKERKKERKEERREGGKGREGRREGRKVHTHTLICVYLRRGLWNRLFVLEVKVESDTSMSRVAPTPVAHRT